MNFNQLTYEFLMLMTLQLVFNFSKLKFQVFANVPLRLRNFLLHLKPDHMSRLELICANLITCRKGNLITCRNGNLITCRWHAGSRGSDHMSQPNPITCRNQLFDRSNLITCRWWSRDLFISLPLYRVKLSKYTFRVPLSL